MSGTIYVQMILQTTYVHDTDVCVKETVSKPTKAEISQGKRRDSTKTSSLLPNRIVWFLSTWFDWISFIHLVGLTRHTSLSDWLVNETDTTVAEVM